MTEVLNFKNNFQIFLKQVLANLKPSVFNNKQIKKGLIKKDILVGLTVAAILIPNAMAYAILAGLPPIVGLYAALPATIIATLWGSSPYIITAPVGVVSLLAGTAVSQVATPFTSEFILLSVVLALIVGLVQFIMGVLKLGFLTRFVSHPVLIGFGNAAAVIIIWSQLPLLLGTEKFGINFINIISTINIYAVILGVTSILIIYFGKKFFPKYPVTLLFLFFIVAIQFFLPLDKYGISLIGDIVEGLPTPHIPIFSFDTFYILFKQAILIAIVGFVETYSIAQTLAKKSGEKVDPDKELNGQGLANIGSSLFGGMVVSGSFSASVLNHNGGTKSSVAAITVSFVILCSLIFLGDYLALIPKPVLAAIVIVAITQLIDLKKLISIYKISKTDTAIAFITILISVFYKVDEGLLVGIVLSLAILIFRSMGFRANELGFHKVHKTLWSRESANREDLELSKNILVLRIDNSILFSNADLLEENILSKIKEHEEEFAGKLEHLILNCAGVNHIDLSGLEALEAFMHTLKQKHIQLSFMLIKDVVFESFKKTGLLSHTNYLHNTSELLAYFHTHGK